MQSDIDFLGLRPSGADGHYEFEVIDRLARLDGLLYGGTAIAASVAAAELVSGRSALWMTTQFVATIESPATINIHAEVLAGGRRTNQMRVTGTSTTDEVIFASLGATGIHRPDGLTGQFETCPTVQSPQDSEPWDSPFTGVMKAAGLAKMVLPATTKSFAAAVEMREPTVIEHPDPGPGRLCVWVRRYDGYPITPAVAAFLADVVPLGVAHALGVLAGGTSLDNTIRFGPFVDTDWILLDLRPHLAVGGYGHGTAHVWNQNGELLATASQTASMIEFDPGQLTEFARTIDDGGA